MIIREGIPSDATSIQSLLEQLEHPLTKEAILKKIDQYTSPHYHLLIIEIENKVAGFASLHWYDVFYDPGYVGRITAFCIDQQFRSRGIGRELLQVAEDYFRKQGCLRVEVSSNERRNDAHRFYLKNGFVINSKRFIKQL